MVRALGVHDSAAKSAGTGGAGQRAGRRRARQDRARGPPIRQLRLAPSRTISCVCLSRFTLSFALGRIIEDVRIDLPRPRAPDLPEFGRLTAALLDRVLGRASKPVLADVSIDDHQTRKLETKHDTVQADPVGT